MRLRAPTLTRARTACPSSAAALPGAPQNNWRWRLGSLATLDGLSKEAADLRAMAERYDRLHKAPPAPEVGPAADAVTPKDLPGGGSNPVKAFFSGLFGGGQ